jgi:hypothetical protein
MGKGGWERRRLGFLACQCVTIAYTPAGHASGMSTKRMIDPLMSLQDLVNMRWGLRGVLQKVCEGEGEWVAGTHKEPVG